MASWTIVFTPYVKKPRPRILQGGLSAKAVGGEINKRHVKGASQVSARQFKTRDEAARYAAQLFEGKIEKEVER